MRQVEHDYEAGLWVPAYHGSRFTIAIKSGAAQVDASYHQKDFGIVRRSFLSETLPGYVVDTLEEAQGECDRLNGERVAA